VYGSGSDPRHRRQLAAVDWIPSPEGFISTDNDGVITALKPGDTILTAKDKQTGKSKAVKITVTSKQATGPSTDQHGLPKELLKPYDRAKQDHEKLIAKTHELDEARKLVPNRTESLREIASNSDGDTTFKAGVAQLADTVKQAWEQLTDDLKQRMGHIKTQQESIKQLLTAEGHRHKAAELLEKIRTQERSSEFVTKMIGKIALLAV